LVAVLEFRNKLPDKDAVDAGYLTDVVRTAVLEQGGGLRVMTRENILVLLQSQGKRLEDCEGECEVDTGRRLGADYLITGEVLRFGKSLKLNLKLHDTRQGQLLGGAQASGATVDELEKVISTAVSKLLSGLGAAPKPSGFALHFLLDARAAVEYQNGVARQHLCSGTLVCQGNGWALGPALAGRVGLGFLDGHSTGPVLGAGLGVSAEHVEITTAVALGGRTDTLIDALVPFFAGVQIGFSSAVVGFEFAPLLRVAISGRNSTTEFDLARAEARADFGRIRIFSALQLPVGDSLLAVSAGAGIASY
jgi:TolB-like protein